MTIRWKLNLVVITLIAIFLITAGFAMRAVRENATYLRADTHLRELAELLSGIHVGIFRHVASARGAIKTYETQDSADRLKYAARDIQTRARLSKSKDEREQWDDLLTAVNALEDPNADSSGTMTMADAVMLAERSIRALRRMHRLAEYASVEAATIQNLRAQQAIWIAGSLTLVLLLVYVLMVRNWLVRPVQLLTSAADAYGAGHLNYVVPVEGRDELAQLARRLETMAGRLAAHQAALLKAHDLSTVGELCTSVAHGLRNPLSALRASVRPEKLRGATREQLETIIRGCVRQADRMEERIAKLFEFSSPRELHVESVAFRQVALTAQAHVRPLLEERNVTLTIEDGTADTCWRVDRDEFADALAELIGNAAHKSSTGSEIILRSRLLAGPGRADKRLQVQVEDHGTGMAPAELGKAFDLFFTSRPHGTGMGLAIVRRTVEKHGGEITLASEVGKGTTVTISIPENPRSFVVHKG